MVESAVNPGDAVKWTLYYAPVLDYELPAADAEAQPDQAGSAQFYTGRAAKRPTLIRRSYMTSAPARDRLIEKRVGILTTWLQRATSSGDSPPRSGPRT